MVSSRSKCSAGAFGPEALLARLGRDLPQPQHYWVAYSGGLDSTVLLHALAEIRDCLAAPLSAVHVDHGLQPGSADWSGHCEIQCRRLDVPLRVLEVDATPGRGDSPEAAARAARYTALGAAIGPGAMLLTAHHLDDQVETHLLQLLRGAGVDGLAAMPLLRAWARGWQVRPLLAWPRATLRTWADARRLEWIEDPSNAQLAADRNYLRHAVLPVIYRRWPAAADNIARSAGLCSEAAQALSEQSLQDLRRALAPDGRRLQISVLCALGEAAARRVLRSWLRDAGAPPMPRRRLYQAISQLCRARADAMPCIGWAGCELRRYRDEVWLLRPRQGATCPATLDWTGDELDLGPGLGKLRRRLAAGGVDPAIWEQGRVQVAFRTTGLSCRPAGRQGSRSFKKLAQELAIPPWLRGRTPLLLIDGRLAAVADRCICEPFAARAGEQGWLIDWLEEPVS